MTDREELHLLSGAYALNALEGEEKNRFEAYLLTSEELRAEVDSLSDTAVSIGLATEPVSPPADLKTRLMAQIAITPQLAPLPVARPTLTAMSAASPEAITTQLSSTQGGAAEDIRTASLGAPSRATARAAARWYTRPIVILVAAAAAVTLFVGGNILGLSAADESQQQAAAVSAIVSAKDSQQAKAAVAGGGTATFVWSVGLRQSAVVIDKLPKLAGDKTYELWYIDKGSHAISAGTFSAASSGTTVSVLAGAMSAGDTFGITVEPSGGSKKPTTAPIVAVPSA
ncbi:anti-sigma factor [Glaciihabitans sp. GrIS 2.15]|uniref:anti-sigma factor n=1 Tax=Glaciihabitans sp. GrIS 2.15 TaxID=3071710 RepID=UPI002DFB9E18|nr:anti-sigma-K factor RskA [Glaciihabitans sp. GrIS 2.15]